MRSLFKVIAFRSMTALFIRMAGLYEIKLN
jgi:hypothetical protein